MKRRVITVIAVVIALLAIAAFYLNYRNRTLSPPGDASVTSGDLKVSVTYSRPSVRGRLIFGREDQDALLPYGKYWRLGANESTEITFNKDVLFNGEPVKAGTYKMYAVPGKESFQIGLNTVTGKWGYSEPDYSKDILKTSVAVETIPTPVEQFTISLDPSNSGVNVICEWSTTRFTIPVKQQ